MEHVVDQYGLTFLFLIVALESAGVWVPGETALIAAGVLASGGHLSIVAVIAVAAAGAILGDNVGYWIGRRYGRRLALPSGGTWRGSIPAAPPRPVGTRLCTFDVFSGPSVLAPVVKLARS